MEPKLVNAAAQQRINNYRDKLDPGQVAAYLTENKATMGDRYLVAAQNQAARYDEAKVVLVEDEVESVLWFSYYNFVEEVDKLYRLTGVGGLFGKGAAMFRQKYLDRGLDGDVLDHLLLDLFGIGGP